MAKKTVSQVNYILRDLLAASVLFSDAKKANGILSFDRLNNSIKEDVIIEPIAMNYATLQQGVINVNIFVKNIELPFQSGGIDKSQRDARRIAELEALAMQSLTPPEGSDDDALYFNGYSFTYQQANTFADTADQYYINIRLEYNAITI